MKTLKLILKVINLKSDRTNNMKGLLNIQKINKVLEF